LSRSCSFSILRVKHTSGTLRYPPVIVTVPCCSIRSTRQKGISCSFAQGTPSDVLSQIRAGFPSCIPFFLVWLGSNTQPNHVLGAHWRPILGVVSKKALLLHHTHLRHPCTLVPEHCPFSQPRRALPRPIRSSFWVVPPAALLYTWIGHLCRAPLHSSPRRGQVSSNQQTTHTTCTPVSPASPNFVFSKPGTSSAPCPPPRASASERTRTRVGRAPRRMLPHMARHAHRHMVTVAAILVR
jgi:hypothetical protein